MSAPVWFITGCTTGLGKELAWAALRRGLRVVATSPDALSLREMEMAFPETVLSASLDVTDQAQIDAVVGAAQATFGGIDVLVNNAGLSYLAAIEEGEDATIRRIFEVNVFGMAAMIRAALPGMRAQRRGTIVNISSKSGFVANPALGYYCASKFAVEGLTEALWQVVEPLGLRVHLIELGGFATGMVARNLRAPPNPAYHATAGRYREMLDASDGSLVAAGDPRRAAEAILLLVQAGRAPHRLILGGDVYGKMVAKAEALVAEYHEWEHLTRSVDN